MPETKQRAKTRAKKLGISTSNVVKGRSGYYIAPAGVTTTAGKKAYADCRSSGGSKEKCARISHSVNKKTRR